MSHSFENDGEKKKGWRVRQKQVEWRRSKVQDLIITGHKQSQIATILQVSEATVSNDVGLLREQARQNMQSHLQDRLPEEYQNCMAGINQVLKMSWEIATKCQGNGDSSSENSNTVLTELYHLL